MGWVGAEEDERLELELEVSIPERVWGGLERGVIRRAWILHRSFQSLRGFGVGWSPSVPLWVKLYRFCFNP